MTLAFLIVFGLLCAMFIGVLCLAGFLRAAMIICFWILFAAACVSLTGCAMTPEERERMRYKRLDKLHKCRDLVTFCPTIPVIVKGSRVQCGSRVMTCPDI